MLADYQPLFKNKNFLYLWISQLLSQITINMVNFLFLIRLFQQTGSSIATSLLWIAYGLPAILVGPFAAAYTDISDKRKHLILSNFFQSMTLILFSFVQIKSVFLLYAVAFTYSLINQFYVPSEQATLPEVVGRNQLSHANSLFFLTQQGALIVGLSLTGPLSNFLGFERTLYLSGILLFMAFLSVLFLPKMKRKPFDYKFEKLFYVFFEKMSEGYKTIFDNKLVLAPFLLLLFIQIMLAIIAVTAPIIAKDIFGIPITLAGLLLVIPTSLGALIGAIYIPKKLKAGVRKLKIIKSSLFALVLGFLSLVFVIPGLFILYRLILGSFILVGMGFAFVGILIPSQTFLQEKTPEDFRGRVFGNYWFAVTIATLIPVLLSGTIAEIFGIKILLLIMSWGLAMIIIYLKNQSFTRLE